MLAAERSKPLGAVLASVEISINGAWMVGGKDGPNQEVKQHIVRANLGRHVHLCRDRARQSAKLVQNGRGIDVFHERYPPIFASAKIPQWEPWLKPRLAAGAALCNLEIIAVGSARASENVGSRSRAE